MSSPEFNLSPSESNQLIPEAVEKLSEQEAKTRLSRILELIRPEIYCDCTEPNPDEDAHVGACYPHTLMTTAVLAEARLTVPRGPKPPETNQS
jgi:hypothetical protein